MQLMHQYTPWATGLLAVLVPVFEPMGFLDPAPGTILGYNYTFISSAAILGSAVSFSSLWGSKCLSLHLHAPIMLPHALHAPCCAHWAGGKAA